MVDLLARFLQSMVDHAKLLSRVMLVIMALLVLANFIYPAGYDRFFWESLPGAGAVYGFVSCVVLIVVAKVLGYKLLYKPEDYYDNEIKDNKLIGNPKHREAPDE
jgi:hypothetical protein